MTLHRLHNLMFWILLVAFIGTTSAVLFFTFGYRFSIERGIFVYTGSIMIKSNPRSVSIAIDGKPVPLSALSSINQTIHIPGLEPGDYRLKVEAPGFRPWEKTVTVQSGISTEFWNIILPKENPEQTVAAEGPIRKVFFSILERKFAVAETSPGGGVRVSVLNQADDKETQAFVNDDVLFDKNGAENIEWSPDGTGLLVPLRDRKTGERTVFFVNLDNGEATDLRTYSGLHDVHDARWNPTDNRSFFTLSGNSLRLIHTQETDGSKRAETFRDDVSSFDLAGRYLYLITPDSDQVFETSLDNWVFSPEAIPGTIPGIRSMSEPKLTVYDRKRVVVYDRKGGDAFLLNDDGDFAPALIELGSGLKGVQFSDDGKKLLFFTDSEISVAFTHKWEVQPYRDSGEIIQVARFASPVSYPQWAKDYEYVLFALGGELKMAELDHRDKRNITTVASFPQSTITQILPDFGKWLIYTLSETSDGNAKFVSFPFPEQPSFFGQ
ncbi:MAG: PEGA domain-containing protein [Candidatus Moraniibacteriota bacterium]